MSNLNPDQFKAVLNNSGHMCADCHADGEDVPASYDILGQKDGYGDPLKVCDSHLDIREIESRRH